MDETQGKIKNYRSSKTAVSGNDCNITRLTVDEWKDIGKPVYDNNTTRSYQDPIQGCVNDCFFIAALISVAWAANAKLSIHPNYRFYNTIKKAWDPAFNMNSVVLAVDNVNGVSNLVYARSSSGYIWPSLYEKAYAKWKDTNHSDTPDIGTLCNGGDGLNALQTICGGSITRNPTTIPIVVGQTRTMYPTIAKTKDVANLPAPLVRNHTYSVLRKSGGSYELRNPCGSSPVYVADFSNFDEWGYVK
jgi:hypothetical protein